MLSSYLLGRRATVGRDARRRRGRPLVGATRDGVHAVRRQAPARLYSVLPATEKGPAW